MTPVQIKALRIELRLTQAQLAEAVGVARTTVVSWERGEQTTPRWFGLAAAAVAAGLHPYQPSSAAILQAPSCRRINTRVMVRQTVSKP